MPSSPSEWTRRPHHSLSLPSSAPMLAAIVLTVIGLAVLPLAADRFVDSAAQLSRSLGISPILVGALLVGFGTSLPEILVSGLAAFRDDPGFAVGNIVGSNVANIALVLGLAALIRPVQLTLDLLKREGALVLVVSAAYTVMVAGNVVSRPEATLLLIGLVGALLLLVRWSRVPDVEVERDEDGAPGRALAVAVLAMGATVAGAVSLVEGAERLAEELNITSAFVAATIVAIGTSLPELAAGIAASRRREGDLVLGNVFGSNLFNILAVGGISGVVRPEEFDSGLFPLVVTMTVVTVLAGLLVARDSKVGRFEGIVLLACFVGFIAFAAPVLA